MANKAKGWNALNRRMQRKANKEKKPLVKGWKTFWRPTLGGKHA